MAGDDRPQFDRAWRRRGWRLCGRHGGGTGLRDRPRRSRHVPQRDDLGRHPSEGAPRHVKVASTSQPSPWGWPGPTQVSTNTRNVTSPASSGRRAVTSTVQLAGASVGGHEAHHLERPRVLAVDLPHDPQRAPPVPEIAAARGRAAQGELQGDALVGERHRRKARRHVLEALVVHAPEEIYVCAGERRDGGVGPRPGRAHGLGRGGRRRSGRRRRIDAPWPPRLPATAPAPARRHRGGPPGQRRAVARPPAGALPGRARRPSTPAEARARTGPGSGITVLTTFRATFVIAGTLPRPPASWRASRTPPTTSRGSRKPDRCHREELLS